MQVGTLVFPEGEKMEEKKKHDDALLADGEEHAQADSSPRRW